MFHSNHEQGSTAFAAIAAFASLALATMYVQNTSDRTQHTIKGQKIEAENEAVRMNNISGLSMMRSILSPAKIAPNVFEPAAYPTNYFSDQWQLVVNEVRPTPSFTINGNRFVLKTFKDANPTPVEAQDYFGENSKKVKDNLNAPSPMTILRLNYDNVHKYFVNSVDVEAKSSELGAKKKDIITVGRIPLAPPEPGPARLEIAPAGTNAWSTQFGTAASPLPAQLYKLRIVASGVVLFGEITAQKGGTLRLGLDDNGIQHKANNIHAKDEILGETIDLQLGEDKTETKNETITVDNGELSGHTTHNADCSFSISPPTSPSSGGTTGTQTSTSSSSTVASENNISVKIYRVDGQEAKTSFQQKIFIQSKLITVTNVVAVGGQTSTTGPGSGSGSGSGGDRCRDRCPRDRETIFGQYMEFLTLSYHGSADKTKIDVLRRAESDWLPGKGGAICGNLELVAQDLVKDMGGVLPTEINSKPNAQQNWDVVKTHVETGGSSMKLERFFAYIAPACGRELVGLRTGCGCFAEDTKIRMADGSEREIRDIRPGDSVYNPMTTKNQKVKRVIAGPEEALLYRVIINGQAVNVTEDHPFLTTSGLKAAKSLSVDDLIVDGSMTFPIDDIRREKRAANAQAPEVWNFELEGSKKEDDHYVLANGVMTGDLYLQIKLKGLSKTQQDAQ